MLWDLVIKRTTGEILVSFVLWLVRSGSGDDLKMLLNSSNLYYQLTFGSKIDNDIPSKVWVCGSKWQQQRKGRIQEIHLRTFDSFYIYTATIYLDLKLPVI